MRKVSPLITTAGLAFVLSSTALAATSPLYRITDLGTPPTDALSGGVERFEEIVPEALNDAGQVVGRIEYYNLDGRQRTQAYLWQEQTGMVPLESLGGEEDQTEAADINNLGQIVGTNIPPTELYRAVLWQPDGTVTDLGDLGIPPEESSRLAFGINDAGQVVGYTIGPVQNVRPYAPDWPYLRDPDTGTQRLPTLADQTCSACRAWAVNSSGMVVGSVDISNPGEFGGPNTPVLWSAAGNIIDLGGNSPPVRTMSGSARDINDAGQVVGGAGYFRAGDPSQAFLWEQTAGMRFLGSLAGEEGASTAAAINEQGAVVGFSAAPEGRSAFLWQEESGMLNLNELVHPDDPLRGAVVLQVAHDINEHGQIAAQGLIEGQLRAFLLTPTDSVAEPPQCTTWRCRWKRALRRWHRERHQ